ncbi:peptidoglycan-binding protein [Thalassobius vesicularis]|uniref:Peptidoglycan-binding protein n=1 Tax=Thalassobius vesicularis TaxID=1294297 RepID=A0A4S3MAQ2_9RHOB|nr:peptidoglycan-binding domain-containing protein [Thalassobius vesicularis]THD75663.1 peptidoglycan-binding protein [Thalassobius vesicularis]
MIRFPVPALLALFGVAACNASLPMPELSPEPEVTRSYEEAPPGARPGSCWGKHTTPALIETVTEQIMLQPAQVRTDGTVEQPAIYKTETHQRITRERRDTWFETPCPEAQTPDFVASVQRALAARGHYHGRITGEMDSATRAAVRRYQKPQGLDSGILSTAAARKLGLIAVILPKD